MQETSPREAGQAVGSPAPADERANHLWLLPCWRRAEETARTLESVDFYDPEAHVVLIVDERDAEFDGIATLAEKYQRPLFTRTNIETVAQKMNWALEQFPALKTYGLLANDMELRTENCLRDLEQACPPFGLSYCNDSIQGASLATHPCVSGDLLRTLGWWAGPGLKHSFVDNILMDFANQLGRLRYLLEHNFYHYHPSARRAVADEGNARVEKWYMSDFKAYQDFKNTEFHRLVEVVLRTMEQQEGEKSCGT